MRKFTLNEGRFIDFMVHWANWTNVLTTLSPELMAIDPSTRNHGDHPLLHRNGVTQVKVRALQSREPTRTQPQNVQVLPLLTQPQLLLRLRLGLGLLFQQAGLSAGREMAFSLPAQTGGLGKTH